jgi:hypothetical protein
MNLRTLSRLAPTHRQKVVDVGETATFGVRELAPAFVAGSLLPALGRPSVGASKLAGGKRHQGAALQSAARQQHFPGEAPENCVVRYGARKREFYSRL